MQSGGYLSVSNPEFQVWRKRSLKKYDEIVATPGLEGTRDLAHRIAAILTETPASETVILDIHELSSIADYFVVCSADNERQIRAIAEEIDEQLSEDGVNSHRVEGPPASGWVLMDFGNVVVHIFDTAQRSFYKIEDAWADAPRLLSIQ